MEVKTNPWIAVLVAALPGGAIAAAYTHRMMTELPLEIERRRANPHERVKLDDAWVARWTRYAVLSGSCGLALCAPLIFFLAGLEPPPVHRLPVVIGVYLLAVVVAGLSFGARQQWTMRRMERSFGAPTQDALGPHA